MKLFLGNPAQFGIGLGMTLVLLVGAVGLSLLAALSRMV